MNIFLKAKHWQLFLLIFILPLMVFIYFTTSIFTTFPPLITNNYTSSEIISLLKNMIYQFSWLPVFMIFIMAIIYGWHWSIAVKLQSKLPNSLKINITLYKIVFVFYILFILIIPFFLIWLALLFLSGTLDIENFDLHIIKSFFSMFQLLEIIIIASSIYLKYIEAKTLKTAELKREVIFGDFAVDIFLIWFSFIGIWFIQPRINNLLSEENMKEEDLLQLEDNLLL